jgi:regulator of protease activity HflC (stomatin/prohibitin superfamily)
MNKLVQRIHIRKNERGFLLRNGDFERILQPGRHWLITGWDRLTVEKASLEQSLLTGPFADMLLALEPKTVAEHFVRVELTETEVGLRHENGVLAEVLAPGTRRLYWKAYHTVRVTVIDIRDEAAVPKDLLPLFTQTNLRMRPTLGLSGVLTVQVPAQTVGLLHIDAQVAGLLTPGVYGFWRFNRQIAVEVVDLRVQVTEVSGQEILTKDKVGLRLNLSASWRYADVATAFAKLQRPGEHLYRELQFGLRAAVGTRTLDELLENKSVIDDVMVTFAKARLDGYGIELLSVGVKDIILPGEMKTILARVVEAEKSAEANVIRRREETAATRSLLNTAKVMEGNPVALRMKELETLERVAERIDKISVFGGLDQLLNNMIKLK